MYAEQCVLTCFIFVETFILSSGVTSLEMYQVNAEWNLFKVKFNRTYSSIDEENYRFSVFIENLKTISVHNKEADSGLYSYWLGITEFSDLGKCRSCYAFAATGALEGHTCRKTGKLVSLSEQSIIDCTNNEDYKNSGCYGGFADRSYIYVEENGGIDTEKSFPYKGKQGDCMFSKTSIGATIKTYKTIEYGKELALQEAVALFGPVSVGIDASGIDKQYKSGIYNGISEIGRKRKKCSSILINHIMLVVGYGKSKKGKEYWLLKNSWGTTFGQGGYMKLIRNKKNRCGIATQANYPVV